MGQRIFQQPFSWKAVGVDLRGRSQNLTINYRTSHQIRTAADLLLPSSLADVDGNIEDRRNTVSVFNGLSPTIEICADVDREIQLVSQWIVERLQAGLQPDEIGVFVSDPAQLERAIDVKSRRPSTDLVPLRPVYMSGAALELGIDTHTIEGLPVRIYSPAKTVVDCFKYRHKIGLDVAKLARRLSTIEALRDCWQSRRCEMDELWNYSGSQVYEGHFGFHIPF